MTMSAEYRSKFAALHRQWWRLHMSEKILEWDNKPKTNKQNKTKEYLHITFSVRFIEVTFTLSELLAQQYTCFPLSAFLTVLSNDETVLARPSLFSVVWLAWLVMSTEDLYHLMLACGLQYDVVHIRCICCPSITAIVVGVRVTEVMGTVKRKTNKPFWKIVTNY